ncbi:hypothetical protein IQ06DRAFT_346283 [Phaeosphaeriaceae sp. SRC1lsM3a]|nr:hypothetical protein IQ06DRAFT_346283 [Stagonospora sp. SRC1lsM3a]
MRSRSDVIATFDVALTGCSVVFAVLNDEIAALVAECQEDMSWSQRAKIVWKDAIMKDLLQQLRGQSAAIGLLIQALQIESISGIRNLLQQNSLLLDRVMSQTRSLRDSHPKVIAPRSIFDNQLDEIGSVIGTEDTDLSESTFVFDDLIVNSKVYRRVLAQARSQMSPKTEKKESIHTVTETPDPPAEEYKIWKPSNESKQLPSFKDYYSQDDIHPNDTVATLWAYAPRVGDEFELERGDMLKVVGVWDDGWATGVKLSELAEQWEVRSNLQHGSGVSNESGQPRLEGVSEIKAFPLVCVCLPQHWRKTIEGGGADTG